MATQTRHYITPEEYLQAEREAAYRSEYLDGEVFAMAGATEPHILISGNVFGGLWTQLKGRPCRTYSSDMKVRVPSTGLYTYPDVAVVCGTSEYEDATQDVLLNPTLIVEVLSKSTEGYDRGQKFANYRQIPSLLEYVLVEQGQTAVEKFNRQEDGRWMLSEARSLNDVVELSSIGCRLTLAEVYERVEFEVAE